MGSNNEREETSSNMSSVSSTDGKSRIYSSSGNEMGVTYMIWMLCTNLAWRIRISQHNIGLCEDQHIQEILNGHPQNCSYMFRMEVFSFHAIYDVLRRMNIREL